MMPHTITARRIQRRLVKEGKAPPKLDTRERVKFIKGKRCVSGDCCRLHDL